MNSNIENRRHCLTMNEFKHRKSSSLFILFQIFEYVFVQSFIDQIRKFAHYQYYYIHQRSRLMHNRKQQKNHSKNCSFFFNEIIRKINFSLSEISRKMCSFSLKITRKIYDFLIWSLHCCLNRIEMIWKIIVIVIFSFNKFELIDLFAKIVAKRQIDDCFWIFFLNDFFLSSRLSCLLKFRWCYDQNSLWICRIDDIFFAKNKTYCFVLNVDLHVNDLVELNYCKIIVFKNISRMRFVDAIDHLFWFLFMKFCWILWCNSLFV